ncbi:MAG: hypothetical protein OQJ89_08840 [Kangiellaceae bacterium]|nr:hypothetical protein [Kangiellaceae bacterium]MCW9017056.1 hypothetical protein [Kangiellaceae bacterium]
MSANQFHSCASYSDVKSDKRALTETNKSTEKNYTSKVASTKTKALNNIGLSHDSSSPKLKFSVSVIGMSTKGMEIASRLSSQQYGVIAVDKMRSVVSSILNGSAASLPAQFSEALVKNRKEKRLTATDDIVTAVKCSDSTFITTNKAREKNSPQEESYSDIQAVSSLGIALKKKQRYHLVVFYDFDNFSCVKNSFIKIIENASGKKCGKDFGVCAVIEHEQTASSYLTAYIKGFDQSSELAVRRLFKPIASVNTYFDY